MRRSSKERRVLGLVETARLALPLYGTHPLRDDEVRHLAAFCRLEVVRTELTVPAILGPPFGGMYMCFVNVGLPPPVFRYVLLHECGHIMSGDIEDPTTMIHTDPLPESEDICDLFALLGIVPTVDIEESGDWLEKRIRRLVPLEDYGWQKYRIPRLAKKLPRVREMVKDLHGYF